MNKILIFVANLLVCIGFANGAVRDGTAVSRTKGNDAKSQTRVSTTPARTTAVRTTALVPRAAKAKTVSRPVQKTARTATSPRAMMTPVVTARVVNSSPVPMSETRTGAEYERCKSTYFSCMDQFCTLKNDKYRRCSCNDRVFQLEDVMDTLQGAGEKLTVFTENLDVVGMTAAQAEAMRLASEGEKALTDDNSASKALLQAIMNSIRGDDSNVAGKYSDLNSINIAFDTVNAFGMTDVGQAIAAYNGQALYNAVYPQCRNAVRADCNDASLQRAITAYLMAVEQDCNTVQAAVENTQKQLKAAVREGGAMLDLARVENRQKHNSSDITTCINEVESAILSEEVCGADYHKCLDNGEFIDVSTGAPIAGVEDFYKLEQLLVFSDGIEAVDQKLSKNSSNRPFVQNFETRYKKFAEPALDKCVENADVVWSEYLDKAMLAIYYAQKDKVAEIKQGCFDFVSSCYMNGDTAITSAMAALTGDSSVVLQPDKIALNSQMCSDYVNSCNNMFDENIIASYVENQQTTDTLTACRAVVRQCFDKYGDTNYENFYYPYSGLFTTGLAPDWFTLYEYTYDDGKLVKSLKSECARQLQGIAACADPTMIEKAFGGLDKISVYKDGEGYKVAAADTENASIKYGVLSDENAVVNTTDFFHRYLRPTGVATEVYNQIISVLTTQCMNLQGRFMESQWIKEGLYHADNFCISQFTEGSVYNNENAPFVAAYGIGEGEDMCPRDYGLGVDTQSWGACLCWENGARRSKWGRSAKCVAEIPVDAAAFDASCVGKGLTTTPTTVGFEEDNWCSPDMSGTNQVCPIRDSMDPSQYMQGRKCNYVPDGGKAVVLGLPEAIE